MSNSDLEALKRALEAGNVYSPESIARNNLRRMLGKLGIKSARGLDNYGLSLGAPLQVEDIQNVMRGLAFDMDNLRLWGNANKK